MSKYANKPWLPLLSGKSRSSMCKYMGQAIRLPYIALHTDTKKNVKYFFYKRCQKAKGRVVKRSRL